MSPRITTVLALLGFLAVSAACSGPGSQSTGKSADSSAAPSQNQIVEAIIHPGDLDSADNQYRGLYQPWDRWIAQQIEEGEGKVFVCNKELDKTFRAARAEDSGLRLYSFLLDERNNQVPMCEAMKLGQQAQSEYRDADFLSRTRYAVLGHPPAEIASAWTQQILRQTATTMPDFPDWLMRNPPLVASMLPDGRIKVRGELGSGRGMTSRPSGGCCGGEGSDSAEVQSAQSREFKGYIMYASDGRELGRVEDGNWWRMLYGLDKPMPEGHIDCDDPWVIKFRADYDDFTGQAKGRILSIWLWSGQQITEDEIPPLEQRDFKYLKSWDAVDLNRYGPLRD